MNSAFLEDTTITSYPVKFQIEDDDEDDDSGQGEKDHMTVGGGAVPTQPMNERQ